MNAERNVLLAAANNNELNKLTSKALGVHSHFFVS